MSELTAIYKFECISVLFFIQNFAIVTSLIEFKDLYLLLLLPRWVTLLAHRMPFTFHRTASKQAHISYSFVSFFIAASYFVLLLCQWAIWLLLISVFEHSMEHTFFPFSHTVSRFFSIHHTEFLLLFIDSISMCQHVYRMPPSSSYAITITSVATLTLSDGNEQKLRALLLHLHMTYYYLN